MSCCCGDFNLVVKCIFDVNLVVDIYEYCLCCVCDYCRYIFYCFWSFELENICDCQVLCVLNLIFDGVVGCLSKCVRYGKCQQVEKICFYNNLCLYCVFGLLFVEFLYDFCYQWWVKYCCKGS